LAARLTVRSDLQRRGCFRTAFEHARLLLALDPAGDPHGALLHLDFLAPKAGLGAWALELWAAHATRGPTPGAWDVTALPGWAFARALALRQREDAAKDAVRAPLRMKTCG
jgi:hypothetical protein